MISLFINFCCLFDGLVKDFNIGARFSWNFQKTRLDFILLYAIKQKFPRVTRQKSSNRHIIAKTLQHPRYIDSLAARINFRLLHAVQPIRCQPANRDRFINRWIKCNG